MISKPSNSNSENILPKLSLSLSGPPEPKFLDKYVSFESILLDKDIALEAMDYLDKISYFDQIDEDSESDSDSDTNSALFQAFSSNHVNLMEVVISISRVYC